MALTSEPQIDFPALLASSVHDMKNSLSSMKALTARLETHYQGHKPSEFKLLEFETNRMNNNLMQLLMLYKIGVRQFSPAIDELVANDVLQEVAAQQSTLLHLNGFCIDTQCHGDLTFFGDFNLISNALGSIVNNALRYCQKRILLSAYQENDLTVFAIEDDGNGYPDQLLANQSYHNTQADLAGSNSGLGIFFAATIAQLHRHGDRQGYIVTDNQSCLGGARFRLYLP